MTKLYISPTNQVHNAYSYGSTNEMEQCAKIAKAVGKELANYVVDYKVGDETKMMWITDYNGKLVGGRIKDAIDWKANYYIEIHTNAAGSVPQTSASGAVMLIRMLSDRKSLAEAMIKALNAIAPVKSNRSSPVTDGYSKGYGAVCYPENNNVKALMIEVNFHDYPAIAKWIIENSSEIGKTIAQTLAKELKLSKKEQPKPTTRFSDVSKSYWAYDHIENLAKLGIVQGYADRTFKPEQPITRAQVCKIVDLAMKELQK